MDSTTLTSKGQITLPKAVRDRLALKQGDRLRVAVESDGRVSLQRERRPSIDDVCGLLRRLAPRQPVPLAELRAAVRRRAKRKHSATRA